MSAKSPILAASRVHLRPVAHDDVGGAYSRWMRDPDIQRFLESRFDEPSTEGLHAYIDSIDADPRTHFFAIVLTDDDRHVGNIKLGPIEQHHRRADIGIMIGERDQWGKGIATEAIEALARWAFQDLELNKLTAGAYASNIGSIRAFERAGFHIEARRHGHYLLDAHEEDAVLLARFRDAVQRGTS